MSAPAHERILARRAEIARHYKAKANGKRPFSLNAVRIAELHRLFRTRHRLTLPNDDNGRCAAFVMAHHLARRPGDPQQHITRWLELEAPWMSTVDTAAMINAVLDKPLRFRADTIARRLQVTEAERSRLRLTTIGAIDMTKAERAKRRRERHRRRQQARRRAGGSRPRPEYEAQSLRRTKPWVTLGMSRATWYRAGKPTPETSPCAA